MIVRQNTVSTITQFCKVGLKINNTKLWTIGKYFLNFFLNIRGTWSIFHKTYTFDNFRTPSNFFVYLILNLGGIFVLFDDCGRRPCGVLLNGWIKGPIYL